MLIKNSCKFQLMWIWSTFGIALMSGFFALTSSREHRTLLLAIVLMAVLLTGCVSICEHDCLPGEKAMVSELMYFGLSKPDGTISEKEWTEFLHLVVTPRFPKGISVWRASGQWLSSKGIVGHEHSYVLNIIHPETKSDEAAVREIMAEYKTRFRQEGVLRVKSRACISR